MAMTSGAAMLGMQGIGLLGSTVGTAVSASSQRAALDAQARVQDANAKLAQLQADSAMIEGQRSEQKIMLQGAQLKSTQRASMAANGVDLSSETAQNVLNSADVMTRIDADTAAANALRAAWGYRNQATSYASDALMKRATAKGISPWSSAGATLLTGATSMGMNYLSLDKAGAFSKPERENLKGGGYIDWNGPRRGGG